MMPIVECVVEGCVHYLPGKHCGAEAIKIKGENADRVSITDCETYRPRSVGGYIKTAMNVNYSGIVSSTVSQKGFSPYTNCTVDKCSYNVDGGRCSAELIRISGSTATTTEETECSTFQEMM